MLTLEIGGTSFRLETAAVSCLRYRRDYGESFPVALSAAGTLPEVEGLLVRLCHTMLAGEDRPALLDFAALCRRDGDFLKKGLAAKAALLSADPRHEARDGDGSEEFDEYKVLALSFAAGLDFDLWYELPILHILAVAEECFALRGDGGETAYHPMTQEEMQTLYPR